MNENNFNLGNNNTNLSSSNGMPNQNQPMTNQVPLQISQQPSNLAGTKKNNTMLFIILGVVIAIVIGVVCLFVFKGSNKTLTCTMSQQESGMEMNAEVNVKFKNNKANKVDMKMIVGLGELSSYKDLFVEQFESQFKDYSDKGIDVKISSTDKEVIINMSATKKQMEEAGEISTSSDTYKGVKKDLEDEGFTCK